MIWVKRADGEILAESSSLQIAPESFQSMLMAVADMPLQTQSLSSWRSLFRAV
jgi:hypothetical protein